MAADDARLEGGDRLGGDGDEGEVPCPAAGDEIEKLVSFLAGVMGGDQALVRDFKTVCGPPFRIGAPPGVEHGRIIGGLPSEHGDFGAAGGKGFEEGLGQKRKVRHTGHHGAAWKRIEKRVAGLDQAGLVRIEEPGGVERFEVGGVEFGQLGPALGVAFTDFDQERRRRIESGFGEKIAESGQAFRGPKEIIGGLQFNRRGNERGEGRARTVPEDFAPGDFTLGTGGEVGGFRQHRIDGQPEGRRKDAGAALDGQLMTNGAGGTGRGDDDEGVGQVGGLAGTPRQEVRRHLGRQRCVRAEEDGAIHNSVIVEQSGAV